MMHLSRNSLTFPNSMNGFTLDAVMDEKDLGVLISYDLKVSNQCFKAYGKANKILEIIIRTIENKRSGFIIG